MLVKKETESVNWCSNNKQLVDCLIKVTSPSHKLISVLNREDAVSQIARSCMKTKFCCLS